jgi:hypothetical protein
MLNEPGASVVPVSAHPNDPGANEAEDEMLAAKIKKVLPRKTEG